MPRNGGAIDRRRCCSCGHTPRARQGWGFFLVMHENISDKVGGKEIRNGHREDVTCLAQLGVQWTGVGLDAWFRRVCWCLLELQFQRPAFRITVFASATQSTCISGDYPPLHGPAAFVCRSTEYGLLRLCGKEGGLTNQLHAGLLGCQSLIRTSDI